MINGDYILIVSPDEYPGKKYRGRYIYEHHYVWWLNTGETVPQGSIIHHIDGNKHNNTFSNLQLMTNEEHSTHHYPEHHKPAEIVIIKCDYCGIDFEMQARNWRSKVKKGQERFYCCKSHQVKYQWHVLKCMGNCGRKRQV